MVSPQPQPRFIRPGRALNLTDQELERLAEVSDADILLAKALWKQIVKGEMGDLLDADFEREGRNTGNASTNF